MKIEYFNPITISTPKDRIYSRLGYAKGVTKLSDKQREEVEDYIEGALEIIELKGVGVILPIKEVVDSKIILTEDISFGSEALAEFLANSQEVLLMAATSGAKIAKVVSEDSAGKDITAAVVFDAVASEMTDSALSWIINYFNRQLSRENKQLTSRRFSAGYGDFSLENQKIIYDFLKLEQLGISLSDNYMLIPEKSVTAISGIGFKQEDKE
ncbi:MAG: methionine synthase [Candidatus Omnitrophica bacterium]|nr:methionine synthase [Candidatus Omnitrophota bacterium]